MWFGCKHSLIALRESHGSIVNIASMAAIEPYPYLGYKTTKAGVVALTENLAVYNAEYGVRSNAILPGLMNTPMAIENRIGLNGMTRDDVVEMRNKRVPLGRKMGTGWGRRQRRTLPSFGGSGFHFRRLFASGWRAGGVLGALGVTGPACCPTASQIPTRRDSGRPPGWRCTKYPKSTS